MSKRTQFNMRLSTDDQERISGLEYQLRADRSAITRRAWEFVEANLDRFQWQFPQFKKKRKK